MIRKLKNYWKIILLIIVLLWGYLYYRTTNSSIGATQTTIVKNVVKRMTIENSIKVTWTAALIDEQKMRFNQNWKVAIVNFKDWDRIKKWQIIAELDSTDALNSINQSKINLANSRIKLQQILKGPEEKDLLKSNTDVSSTENNLLIAKQNLDNLIKERDNKLLNIQQQIDDANDDINNKNSQLDILKNELDLLIQQWDKDVSDFNVDTAQTINTAYIDSKQYLIDAKNYLNEVDDLFGITSANDYKNDAYEDYLSVKNSAFKVSTEDNWNKAKILLDKYNNYYYTLNSSSLQSWEMKELLKWLQTLYQTLIDISKLATDAMNSSVTATNFTQTQIDSYANNMTQIGSSSKSTLDKIKNSITNIDKLSDPTLIEKQKNNNLLNKQNSITSLENSLKSAKQNLVILNNSLEYSKKDYETKINQQQYSIQNYEANLWVNKANLDYIKKWSTQEEILLAQNDIVKQELSLADSQKTLDKYRLEAPFDGVIRQIDFKVWDNIVSDEEKYVYIENPNLIQITALLDQIDVVKAQLWQPVRIVFDSYSNLAFTGILDEINSTPITTSWVTSYQVKITLDKWENKIYSWMTAKVYVIVDLQKDILTVPLSFIQKVKWKNFVLTLSWTQEVMQEVMVWINNWTDVQILTWLNEWDSVIRKINVVKSSLSSSSQRTMMPTWWGSWRVRTSWW